MLLVNRIRSLFRIVCALVSIFSFKEFLEDII